MVTEHGFDKPQARTLNKNRLAIGLSITFHLCLLAVLFIVYIPPRASFSPPDSSKKPDNSKFQAERNAAAQAKQASTSATIQSSVKAHMETAVNKPAAEALVELDTKVRQLDKYIDARTVEETAKAVAGSLGIERSTYQPKADPVPGALDPDTAQILDIVPNAGGFKEEAYMATMIDAEGHQAQIPMSESEGKTAYDAFQKMKNYPALEGLYRQIVMPLIQKIISSPETIP